MQTKEGREPDINKSSPSGVKYIAIQGFDVIMKRDQTLWFLAAAGPGLANYWLIIREVKMSLRDLKDGNETLC